MRRVAFVALLAAASFSAVDAFDPNAAMNAFINMMVDDSKFHAPQVKTSGRSSTGHRDANYVPVVLMHGLGDAGDNPGMQSLASSVQETYPGIYSVAVDVADGIFSFLTPMWQQVSEFAEVVRRDENLRNGFNVLGLSQGGIVIRGYIEAYSWRPGYPKVNKMISICGVQNGVFDCPLEMRIIPFLCEWFKSDPYNFLFNGSIPLSFSDYFVTSEDQSLYLQKNKFLTVLNNQLPNQVNSTYTQAITSLEQMVLIEATQDTVVYPYQSEQFGGYRWGTRDSIFTLTESEFYQQDLFGLRTLNEAGKVKLDGFKGDHIRFSNQFWHTHVLPYFNQTVSGQP